VTRAAADEQDEAVDVPLFFVDIPALFVLTNYAVEERFNNPVSMHD